MTEYRPSVGIVGMGIVGKNIKEIFPWTTGYDPGNRLIDRQAVNEADFCFVSVPTPMRPDGSCETGIVEGVVSWLEANIIIIKSTVAVGTIDRLIKQTGKKICFSPEYTGATQHSRPENNFVILGGERKTTGRVAQLYQFAFNCSIKICQTDAKTAELTKYMENAFLANKVVFCNEMYRIANAFGINYNELRELFLLDSRMNCSHTFVYEKEPYYDSKCFNKDLPALCISAKKAGYKPEFVWAIISANETFKKRRDPLPLNK